MKVSIPFNQIGIKDIPKVGGKNASLGEMITQLQAKGISIPNGFAIVADAFRLFCKSNGIDKTLNGLINSINKIDLSNLDDVGQNARNLILDAKMPSILIDAIKKDYELLCETCGKENLDVAVRSSATAEDLPSASFAGRMESFLNISGGESLIRAVQHCYASLYTNRALKYRMDMGFTNMDIAISVGVQQMVRSDKASSGVAFTIDPDTGFQNVIIINSCWGLGENIVQGRVTPDEWMIFKPTLFSPAVNPIIKKHRGNKEFTMIYSDKKESGTLESAVVNIETAIEKRNRYSLSQPEVIQLAKWCQTIEMHYGKAMDIEWAKDGIDQKMYIVQARPETVHGKGKAKVKKTYSLIDKGQIITQGIALGQAISAGKARILHDPKEGHLLQEGEILVTDITNPDWDPILKKAAGIVTNKGGRTSHAAIVARELGTVAVVGCGNATQKINSGSEITVSCAESNVGKIYKGSLKWNVKEQDFSALKPTKTTPMLILADPKRAFELSSYPCKGVGLMRLEFAISNTIKIHPLALIEPEKVVDNAVRKEITEITHAYPDGKSYFVEKLAEAVTEVAAAFYPNDVIVRLSDFKSNEYANLIGGQYFEPKEENPMIGLRGASRYYSEFYRKGFALECEAMKKVRNEMGMTNVKLMVPFCRTVEEGKKVLDEMARNGLKQKENGLEVYVMIEIPSNVLLADDLAKIFDGFSIGSNDLTQLTLGLDRDSELVSYLFNEENPAVKKLIKDTIAAAKRNNIKVGLCGQAPSDISSFAAFLVEEGIDSISFNADALIRGIENIYSAEQPN